MSYIRTSEHRRLRAKLIHRWKPWKKSTGPISLEGKVKVSRNAYKGGLRQQLRMLSKSVHNILLEQKKRLKHIGHHE